MNRELKDLFYILFNKKKYKEELLKRYADSINSMNDLYGDGYDDMSKLFYLVNRHFLHWMSNDPDSVVNEKEIEFRKKIYKILQKKGPDILGCTQVFENRKYINNPKCKDSDDKVILPDRPVIFVANHGFRDDVLATTLATKRPPYLYCGSLPLFFNTKEGFAVAMVGDIMVNRRNKNSKKASIAKVKKLFDYGTDLVVFPEGGWNKRSEIFTNPLWKGVYEFSCINNYDVVPIVHYVRDMEIVDKKNIIHTIVDDPIPLYSMPEKEALIYLRDVLNSWQYKMAEVYGRSTRKEEMKGFGSHDEKWKACLEKRMVGIPRYDSEIEMKSDYRPKDIVLPDDAFGPIANIKNITPENAKMVVNARKLVKERKDSDFQHMM